MKKGFIIGDFLITTIILSAIGSIFLSTYLMNYQSEKLNFETQKKMSFHSLVKKGEEACKLKIKTNDTYSYVWDSSEIMNNYRVYLWARCEPIENDPYSRILLYSTCIYPKEDNAAFIASNQDSDYVSKNCRSGERYVGIGVMAILLSCVVELIIPYTKTYIKEKERVTGKIYTLVNDIEINKLRSKKIVISEDKKILKLYRSVTCYAIYAYDQTKKEIHKTNICSPEEIKSSDRSFYIQNIESLFFDKNSNTIYLDIREKNKNYENNFIL